MRYFLMMLILTGCAPARALDTGPCAPEDLAKIEAAFVAEAVLTCRAEGAKTIESCKAYPSIRAKYAAKREAWVKCN